MSKQQVNDTEHVLLCESSHIQGVMGNSAITPISRKMVIRFAEPSSFWFGPRNLIETDMKYVQLVSYVIIEHDSQILCYQRGHASSEQRLKNKLSIGLGGHISLTDARFTHGILDIMKTIKSGAAREVEEELEIPKVVARKKYFLLHSRLNAVDKVHCGLVEIWNLETPQVAIKDESLSIIGFKSLSELATTQGFETWSMLLIQHLNNRHQHSW